MAHVELRERELPENIRCVVRPRGEMTSPRSSRIFGSVYCRKGTLGGGFVPKPDGQRTE